MSNFIIFKTGLSLKEDDIMMVIDFSGRFNGEAFVRFGSIEDANKGLDKHKKMINPNRLVVFQGSIQLATKIIK